MTHNTGSTVLTETLQQWVVLLEVAAREVFQMMVGGELHATESEDSDCGDVTAMVGLAGELCGLITIRCSPECACQIASAMLGMTIDTLDGGALDALGEICNMVAGNFKAKVNGLADSCVLSVPTVIRGSDYEWHAVGEGVSADVRQSYNGCPLQVKLTVHQ